MTIERGLLRSDTAFQAQSLRGRKTGGHLRKAGLPPASNGRREAAALGIPQKAKPEDV